jgi:hypothetical protein
MNKKEVYTRINNLKRLLDFNSLAGSKVNNFYILDPNLKESKEHLRKKLEVCTELRLNNYDFYTEVKFKEVNLGKADIVAFNNLTGDGIIIEIVKSEKETSKIRKIKEYPIDFELIFVKINEEFKL